MNHFVSRTTFTALSILFFANFFSSFGQTDSIYRLPAGTRFRVKLDAEINSRVSSVNDTFIAIVAKPVLRRDTVVIPAGVLIEGRITHITHASAGGQDGKLDVVFETLKISNEIRHIDGVMTTEIAARSSKTFGILSIVSGVAAGAAIGAVSHSSSATL
ncbi:MAG: hypothetical protein ABJB40_08980, partial [Acidobacteriota bacterium]